MEELTNRARDMAITVSFLNGGPVYCVSQAVIFTATGRMGGSLLTENILQTKPNRKREPRTKESQRKKKTVLYKT